jgi:hypothetical protein
MDVAIALHLSADNFLFLLASVPCQGLHLASVPCQDLHLASVPWREFWLVSISEEG